MFTKSVLCSSLLFFSLLTGQLDAQEDRKELKQICEVVSYQPKVLRGCGLMLDLASFESTESIPLTAKQQIIEDMQTLEAKSIVGQLKSYPDVSQFLHMVTLNIDLSQKTAVVGEQLDCKVTSLSGKSVASGYLLQTKVRANDPTDKQVYGIAGGFVSSKDSSTCSGTILKGCRTLVDLTAQVITKEGDCVILLNIEDKHAGTQVASEIANTIRQTYFQSNDQAVVVLDGRHVKVSLPSEYDEMGFEFVSEVLDLRVYSRTQLPVVESVAHTPKDRSR